MSAVDEALLDAARLEADDDVLVLGGGALALGAVERLREGWVYVVRREVDELEELLRQAHAVGAAGMAYLVGEAPVLPLPDGAVGAVVGRVPTEDGATAAELARVLSSGGRVALAAVSGDTIGKALAGAGFADIAIAYPLGGDVLLTGTRR